MSDSTEVRVVPDLSPADVAMTLKELREHLGTSREDVASALGVPVSLISALESAGDITIGRLAQYIEALGGTLSLTVIDAHGNRHALLGEEEACP